MANLHKVDWREGVLDEADVQGADLSKADFRAPICRMRGWPGSVCGRRICAEPICSMQTGLTQEQGDLAEIDARTKFPAYFRD